MLYEYRNALGRDKLFDEQVCDLTERVKKLRAEAKIAVEAADKREKKKLQTEYDDRISELTERLTIAKEANWLYEKFGEGEYHNILGLCKVAYTTDDTKCDDKDGISIEEKGWSLTPGAYVGVAPVEDDGVDFEERMKEIYTIERAVIRSTETPRTLRYGKHEKIIFPYTYDENGLVRFGEGEFERLYPEAAAYLNEFRDDLSKRQSDNSAKWYEYGRSQALSGLNSKKLLISTVVTNDVDVYELEQECIPYAGMYIVEKEDNNEYELIDAMRILRSGEFKEYVFKVGIPISGKSVRITSKDVENYMF